MDTYNQIQLIQSQIMGIKFQIDNISIQNNNMSMMNNTQIGEQLLNLSMQILNTGIQTFNIGKKLVMNCYNYIEQLKMISEQINSLINSNNIMPQQPMMMMPPLPPPMLIQQNWMNLYQNENDFNEQENPLNNQKNYKINVVFKSNTGVITTLVVDKEITVEELSNKYINKRGLNRLQNLNFKFNKNGNFLKRNDKRKIIDIPGFNRGPVITIEVIE